jgi:uncharacterized protein
MISSQASGFTPWYKQFWPWFLIALPATVVVAGLITVYIAFNNVDPLVRDDYYRDGLAINNELKLEKNAAKWSISGRVQFDVLSGEVFVDLDGESRLPEGLIMELVHPVEVRKDQTVKLVRISKTRYRGDLQWIPSHRYYLRVSPMTGEHPVSMAWRINGEIDFDRTLIVGIYPGD